jgi:UDP:flavonoid glycosyltransferase YjiC (YdhE family)
VTLETWSKWSSHAEREGMRFAAAPEYQVFPSEGRALKPYAAAVRASAVTRELIRSVDPEVVVADILTVAATLAAELEQRPWATLVPHVLPMGEPGFPVYAVGAVYPRTAFGARLWRTTRPLLMRGEQQGREELNETRARVGLPPLGYVQGGTSRELALVATLPQLEYPREIAEPWLRVTGPLMWEQPFGEVELPAGEEPLVLVAPSTSQDPDHRLLRAALAGLANEPVRVLATTNRRAPSTPIDVPANARLVDWVSYAKTMPRCAAVICHAGHGTVVRALASGTPVVACPHAGDMAENAARLRWSGLGVSLPRRFHTPRGVRLAVKRLLADPGYAERAAQVKAWCDLHDGAATAADELERFVAARYPPVT